MEFQMRQRALRAQKIAKRQFGHRAAGLMPIRSFFSRVGTSMTNLAGLGRPRRNGTTRPKATETTKASKEKLGGAAAEPRSRKISRESSKMRISMIHAGSLSSMAEEGAEEVVQFNIGGRER